MKINISIEFDKELTTAIKATVTEFSEGIKSLQANLEKSDKSGSTKNVPDPMPKQTKPTVKRKKRPKQTLRGTVLKVVKQNKDGISRKDLLEKTGFSKRQIIDCVYQLKAMQKIEKTEDGLFKPL
jgi:hypothetical protein